MGLISRVSSRTYRNFLILKMPINKEKLAAMQARGPQAKVGGARRKKKVTQSKNQVSDDKKIQQTLKKFSCSNLPGIDEVKKITEIPGVLNQLGLEGLQGLQQWAKSQGIGEPQAAKKADGLADIPETGNFDEAEEDAVE